MAYSAVKEEYKGKAEQARELSRILETKSVKRYMDIMGYEYPKIAFEEAGDVVVPAGCVVVAVGFGPSI